jgi:hypothetical protein
MSRDRKMKRRLELGGDKKDETCDKKDETPPHQEPVRAT